MTLLRQGSGGQAARPPRLASWLLSRAIDDRRREELLGDLEELFQVNALEARPRAPRAAGIGGKTADAIVDAIRERRRQPQGSPRGDSLMQTIVQDLRYAIRSLTGQSGLCRASRC